VLKSSKVIALTLKDETTTADRKALLNIIYPFGINSIIKKIV